MNNTFKEKGFVVYDDILPVSYQEEIKNTMLGINFPWFFTKDVTNNKDLEYGNNAPACTHNFVINSQIASQYWSLVSLLPHIAAEKIGTTLSGVSRVRSFLQFPLHTSVFKDLVDPLHIDSMNPHVAMVYYVADSDGCTILANKQYEAGKPFESGIYAKDYDELYRVMPKQGRVLIFNGAYYHTAEQPRGSNMRCIINFNFNTLES